MYDKKTLEEYFVYDKPIPYKELMIYPLRVSEYLKFFSCVECLTFNKNRIPDVKIIKMTYLDFIFALFGNKNNNNRTYEELFYTIIKLCLHIDKEFIKFFITEKNRVNMILQIPSENGLKDIILDGKDFDNIKNIILYQNYPDYDDSYIDPKVEAALMEAKEFINKHNHKTDSFEDQIVCVMVALHETDELKIQNLTIRKFTKILQRYDFKLHYEIYKTAEFSGMVSFKEPIEHWMSDLSNKNKYADLIASYDELEAKIKSVG